MGKATARPLSTLPLSVRFNAKAMPGQANPLKLQDLCEPYPIIRVG